MAECPTAVVESVRPFSSASLFYHVEKNAVDPDPNLWFIVGFICLILMKVIHFSGAKYPGGSVYIFQGQNILVAQYIFALLYVLNLGLVFRILGKFRKIWPI